MLDEQAMAAKVKPNGPVKPWAVHFDGIDPGCNLQQFYKEPSEIADLRQNSPNAFPPSSCFETCTIRTTLSLQPSSAISYLP